jgi:hypothetical protein
MLVGMTLFVNRYHRLVWCHLHATMTTRRGHRVKKESSGQVTSATLTESPSLQPSQTPASTTISPTSDASVEPSLSQAHQSSSSSSNSSSNDSDSCLHDVDVRVTKWLLFFMILLTTIIVWRQLVNQNGSDIPFIANGPTLPSDCTAPGTNVRPIGLYWQIHPATGWGLYGANMALQLRRRALQLGYYPVLLQAPHSLAFQSTTPVVNLTSSTASATSSSGKSKTETMGGLLQSLWNEQKTWRESTPQIREFFQREAERASQPVVPDDPAKNDHDDNNEDDEDINGDNGGTKMMKDTVLPSLTSSLVARFNFPVISTIVNTFDANALVRYDSSSFSSISETCTNMWCYGDV